MNENTKPTDEKWPDAHPVRERAAKDLEESAPSDAEAELAGWKADADRCREKWTHYEKLCDQLRAEVQAKQHAIDAAAAQIAQLSAAIDAARAKEGRT